MLIESFPITLPDGTVLYGTLLGTQRRGGRRIIVKDYRGAMLFDSDDAHDLASAMNSLDHWLDEKIGRAVTT